MLESQNQKELKFAICSVFVQFLNLVMNRMCCIRCVYTVMWYLFLNIQEVQGGMRMNTNCRPPRGDVCIEISQCPYFVKLLETTPIPRPLRVVNLIRNHHCGFEGNSPKVCCTTTSEKVVSRSRVEAPDVTLHPNLALLPRNSCGRTSHDFRITAGSKTTLMEFPWMAILAFYTKNGVEPRCGGTVINKRYVLTAAHCVVNSALAVVRLGEHNIFTDKDCDDVSGICSPSVQDFYVEDVIVHPEYNRITKENDIALIRLATPANFTYENIQPICLPVGETAKLNLNNKYAIVSGWGVTENGFKSEELLKVTVPVVPYEDCKRTSKSYEHVTYKHICAGGNLGRDSCGGDSGGPLKYVVHENQVTRFVQYGIVSYGPRYCGTHGQPGVYTNVVYYMKWILNNLKPPLD